MGNALTPREARALAAIEALERQLREARSREREPIAVVGIGCRFPGAAGPAEFWRLLTDGRDATRPLPEAWRGEPGIAAARAGLVDDFERFDAAFFEMSPSEARAADPQHRLLLEVAWEAIGDAAARLEDLASGRSTGVYVGISPGEHARTIEVDAETAPYAGLGTHASLAANRISHVFGLVGPSLVVDTGCSSSLVAIHLACAALRSGECDAALAGGVAALLSADGFRALSAMGALSPEGRCKTFDADADGFARGEGCGLVLLKRLGDAVAAGDRVHAVVLGSAVNHDRRTLGLTVPSAFDQADVVARALRNASVDPDAIGYLEAHGTGTLLGDPIEVEALRSVFGRRTSPLPIGSVKTNLGHLEAAAGISGFVKVVLAIAHRRIPPSLHYRVPNPHIEFGPLAVRTELGEWPGPGPRTAGVSAFGMGGTNAHVVVGEGPPATAAPGEPEPGRAQVLAISARSGEALRAQADAYASFLEEASGACPGDLAWTSTARGNHLPHRLAVVGRDRAEWAARLSGWLDGTAPAGVAVDRASGARRLVYVFGGEEEPWGDADRGLEGERGYRPDGASLVARQVALARLLASWGIVPDAVVGHGAGEIAAAHVAGALSPACAVALAGERERAIRASPGALAAVDASELEAREVLAGVRGAWVAAIDGPRRVLVAGEAAAVDRAIERFRSAGLRAEAKPVPYALHGSGARPCAEALRAALPELALAAPAIPWTSTLSGGEMGEASIDHWCRQLLEPVRFDAAIAALLAGGNEVFLEVGPDGPLSAAIAHRARLQGVGARTLAALGRPGASPRERLLEAVAALHALGRSIGWEAVCGGRRRVAELPSYRWAHASFPIRSRRTAAELAPARHPRPCLPTPYAPPATDVERAIVDLWQDALGTEPVGVHDDFFALGGDSLAGIAISMRASRLGWRVTPEQIFANPTPAGLARSVVPAPGPADRSPAPADFSGADLTPDDLSDLLGAYDGGAA